MFIIIVGYLAGFRATLNHCEKAALLNLITFDPKVIEKPVTRLGLKTWMAVLEELEPLVFQAWVVVVPLCQSPQVSSEIISIMKDNNYVEHAL